MVRMQARRWIETNPVLEIAAARTRNADIFDSAIQHFGAPGPYYKQRRPSTAPAQPEYCR